MGMKMSLRLAGQACALLGMALLSGCRVDHPAVFADQVRYPDRTVPFEMVLVPGSADGTIKPFYIGRTEVSWEMFRGWSSGVGPI